MMIQMVSAQSQVFNGGAVATVSVKDRIDLSKRRQEPQQQSV